MTYDEMILVITAAKNGSKIEASYKPSNDNSWWIAGNPEFNFACCDYRVVDPIYKPITVEEIVARGKDSIGKMFFHKNNNFGEMLYEEIVVEAIGKDFFYTEDGDRIEDMELYERE